MSKRVCKDDQSNLIIFFAIFEIFSSYFGKIRVFN